MVVFFSHFHHEIKVAFFWMPISDFQVLLAFAFFGLLADVFFSLFAFEVGVKCVVAVFESDFTFAANVAYEWFKAFACEFHV